MLLSTENCSSFAAGDHDARLKTPSGTEVTFNVSANPVNLSSTSVTVSSFSILISGRKVKTRLQFCPAAGGLKESVGESRKDPMGSEIAIGLSDAVAEAASIRIVKSR